MSAISLRFEIDGMNCAGCAGRAERALLAMPGQSSASVNLASETGLVTLDGAVSSDIRDTLQTAGYPAREDVVTLDVANMNCASCSARVEKALMAVPGVLEASVNLASETAQITVLRGATAPADLARIVTDAGYSATPRQSGDHADPARSDTTKLTSARNATLLAALLTLPVFILEMGGHLFPAFHHWIARSIGLQTSWTIQFLLTSLVLIGPGRGFFTKGLPLLAKRTPDMNSLVALGAAAAWGYSTVSLFFPQILPPGAQNVYFEAAAVIVTLILMGRWMEARAKGRTGAALRKLVGLQAKSARVLRDGDLVELPLEQIIVGDELHLRPGEKIAVDGTVIAGMSYIDESMITGEPVPVAKAEGAAVVAGTLNGQGVLTYRATSVGSDTVLARIIAMVEQAQGAKLPVQALADRVVLIFVPVVILIALLAIAGWLVFGPDPRLAHALVAGVSVLIIACPCAMGLATPTSIMVGTGRAAEIGVLFRKGEALQRLDETRVVAFDKTGTLTLGKPKMAAFETRDGFEPDALLRLAAAVESQSEHPIARAIEDAAHDRDLTLPAVSDFAASSGFGVRAQVEKQAIAIGADRFMAQQGVDVTSLAQRATILASKGQTPFYIAVDGVAAGFVTVADPIKPGARAAVQHLRQSGLTVAMITGDNAATANAIATELGIDQVAAEILPEGKADTIKSLRADLGPVAFVGDGINDAPALALADTGIAIGTGTDIAIESADVVLASGDPLGVVHALDVSRRTMRNIRQNLFWAFAYNIALIPVAAGLFYPILGWQLSPMLGAGAMALSSVFVLSNALRLRHIPATTPGASS
ncbi:Cu+-exporting ATPase [Shimia gijangensis]|uniref:Cu+-exporting ATPase n=1 Tax=Shimia gijangensis TaxID=1470563 RepID=A0A1M6I6S8_9RHOB|nr:heavy metal translocating P-type ATPase [Shimia gijangensis]SHJ30104.1 Cu+-exporting ATPase [Shimia gijangensis]